VPEGHTSHRNARRLTAALIGTALVRVQADDPRVQPQRIPDRLRGDRVERVDAIGKHHLLRFASGRVLHSHLGMVGRWRVLGAQRPLPRRGLWLALWTDRHIAAQYDGPRLRLYEPGEPIPALSSLGPDLIGNASQAAALTATRLRSIDPDRPIGEAVMDQRVVAGIGNVYRSETLFVCGVDPWRRVGNISDVEAEEVGATAARLLSEGVSNTGPITTYRSADPRNRDRTWVYGRRGRPCRRCGTPIRSRGMGDANRTVYWCPVCQV
jgi:endonuclease-8